MAAVPPDSQSPPDSRPDSPDVAADWTSLPRELLHHILSLATAAAADEAPAASHSAAATAGVPCARGRWPALAAAARLRYGVEACCRSWRAAAADLPLHVSVGASPLPPVVAPQLLAFLRRRPLAALHFEASPGVPGCRPGAIQHLAINVLGAEQLEACAASTLRELAVFGYTCSRPLCALLPRYAGLRCLSLSGYAIDLDLEPLGLLPRLEALHIEAEGLPHLDGLPTSLRHLSVSCFANSARLLLPPRLRLDTLTCHCPLTNIFIALSRALEVCASIHLAARAIHMLLRVGGAGSPPADAAAALVAAFAAQPRTQRLRLEAPRGQLSVVLAESGAREHQAAPFRRGRTLDPQAVCAYAQAAGGAGGGHEISASCERPCPSSNCEELLALVLSKA